MTDKLTIGRVYPANLTAAQAPDLSQQHTTTVGPMSLHATSAEYWKAQAEANEKDAARLRDLLRRALPMADALDATKTAVVWTVDLKCDASGLARDIRAALRHIDSAMSAKDSHATE